MNLLFLLLLPFIVVVAAAPVAATILGWVAVSQIRRSNGRLRGLGLAVFDGLLFPLLALDGLMVGVVCFGVRLLAPLDLVFSFLLVGLPALLICVLVDFFIVRGVWRAVNTPVCAADSTIQTAKTTGLSGRPEPSSFKPVLFALLVHAGVLLLIGTALVMVVPRFVAVFADLGVELPKATQVALSICQFLQHLGLPLLALVLGVDALICWLVHRFGRRVGLVVWSVCFVAAFGVAAGLCVLPITVTARRLAEGVKIGSQSELESLAQSPPRLRTVSTDLVIQAGLAQPNVPWPWRELQNRAQTGRLDSDEARLFFEKLTAWLRREHPEGYREPLFSLGDCLEDLNRRQLVPETNVLAFLQAYRGKPSFEPLPRLREGEKSLHFTCKLRSPWHDDLLGFSFMNALSQVTLDGKPIDWGDTSGRRWNAQFYDADIALPELAPGKHVLRCRFYSALAATPDMRGLADVAPVEDWPPKKCIWIRTCTVEFDVSPKDPKVIERTLHTIQSGEGDGSLDVDTASNLAYPSGAMHWQFEQAAQWNASHGVDVVFDYARPLGWWLMTSLKLTRVDDAEWNETTPDEAHLRKQAEANRPGLKLENESPPYRVMALNDGASPKREDFTLPLTFAFATLEGNVGLMQITAFAEDPRSVKIRYKLMQSGEPNTSTEALYQGTDDIKNFVALLTGAYREGNRAFVESMILREALNPKDQDAAIALIAPNRPSRLAAITVVLADQRLREQPGSFDHLPSGVVPRYVLYVKYPTEVGNGYSVDSTKYFPVVERNGQLYIGAFNLADGEN